MTVYQELESTKYLSENGETDYRQELSGRRKNTEFWALAAFYSTLVAAGFFVFQFAGVNVADIFQPAVNAFVDWSINA